MKSYSEQQLRHALARTEIPAGSLVMVHSSLFSLGRVKNCPIPAIPQCHYNAIREMIGPDGTIVVPTFTFDFCRGETFDRQRTPSKAMGSFSEYMRRRSLSQRSPHPIQSLVAEGPLSGELVELDTPGAFERGGSFDRLIDLDAHLLLIGCGVEPVSLVHWAEERVGVPYRYWKKFHGLYRDQGHESHRTYRMYVRDLTLNPRVHLRPIGEQLRERNLLRSFELSCSTVETCRSRDFAEVATAILRDDPTALIQRPHMDSWSSL